MMNVLPHKLGPIGLDIGAARVKAVQLSRGKPSPAAHAAASFDRLEPGEPLTRREAGRIAQVLLRRGFVGRAVTLAAPSDGLIESVLDVPPADSKAPRDQIVRMELARQQRIPPDALESAFWPLPMNEHAGRREQVIAVGYPHARAQDLVRPLSEAGLEVKCIEPAPIALMRACMDTLNNPRNIAAIVDLGATGFRLTLVFANRVVHQRALPFNGTQSLAESLVESTAGDHDLAELAWRHYGVHGSSGYDLGSVVCEKLTPLVHELIEQVGLSFAYVSHQYPAAELGPLLVTGGASRMPGLIPLMYEMLDLPIYSTTPAGTIRCDLRLADELDSPSTVLAAGLAMSGGGR